ncbi:amino acid adenylation domain-containing protein [Streptomyces sp. NPDC058867]|uniref:amino acid adenylation domain-containing protein n=1 Tax=unclassified Streptomyces TaxID=2593676 RepID=UPI0036B93F52
MPTTDRAEAAPGHPLLPAQEGIWTGQCLDPDSPAYNTAEYVLIDGPVDGDAFDRALHHVVAETEALNVSFAADGDGRAREVPAPADGWRLHRADLSTEPDPLACALSWIDTDMDRPVDLARGPVFGHALLRLSDDRYLWYHRVHHIALDGFGLSLVARRVAEVYTALVTGRPVGDSGFGTLAAVREEEDAYRNSERHDRDRAHWTGRYADRPDVASPAGRTALPARGFHRHVADLDAAQAKTLRATARELRVTWSEIVLAVTAAHLHRVTGAPEIVLSVPAMGRLGSVALRVPCMVRNILPLRVTVGPGDTLRELTARVSTELRAGLPHQRYRYEQLRRDLKLVGGQRRLSGPGVNVMPFAYDLRFAGHRSTVHNVSAGPVDDLAFNVYDRSEGGGLRFAVDGNPDLYTEEEVAAHQRHLFDLLDAAIAAPDEPLTALAQHDHALGTGTAPVVLDGGPLPGPDRTVIALITDRAARNGETTALEQDGRQVSYAQLIRSAGEFAGRLADQGIGKGDMVAVALPRGIEAITALLGVLLSGAAYCPLDPTAPASRTDELLASARPALLLTADDLNASGRTAGRAPDAPELDDLAYVIHTSGSTGRPKGVETGHRALSRFVRGAAHRYGLRPEDRVLQFAPLHFDASVEEIFLTLCTGATLVVRPEDMTDSVPGFLAACARLNISFLDLPTAYWHEIAYTVSTGTAAVPGAVRTVVVGGEAALADRVDRWRKTVGSSVRLFNTYGPTEATVVATVADLHDPALTPGDVPIGLPLPGTRAAVADGELYLLGGNLADGYRDASEEERARFAPLTGLPGAPRAYRTGDLVSVGADGQLRFHGRADDEFKISGHRVQPTEVENALLAHPDVLDAAVVGQVLTDGTRRLVAHLVAGTRPPTAGSVRDHLRARLPAAMIPSAIEFTDALPRTSSGKTDRTRLAALVPAPATDGNTADSDGTLLRTITGVWGLVLGGVEVGPHDDVFDLGAQSLQAIQAANRLGVELGRDLKVAWFFQYATPAELALFLNRETPTGEQPGPAEPQLPPTLLADTVLDPDLRPAGNAPRPTGDPQCVLLTGATGFVGVHLLAELLHRTRAEIVCPVRAGDEAEATARVRAALHTHALQPSHADLDRVTAVPADLALPRLGLPEPRFQELAATCDALFHNGAVVSIMREYATLRAANLDSTRELLRMAADRAIPLHYVSTLSVGPPASHSPEVPEDFLPAHPGLRYGYQQSKWASERLLEQAAQRGFPVTVHRLGRVVGPASTGHVNERDFLWSVLRAGIPAGIVPELFDAETWNPADRVAAAVVHLALAQPATTPKVFNHATDAPVRMTDVYSWLTEYGYPCRVLPLTEWRTLLPGTAPDAAALLAFLDTWTPGVGTLTDLGPGRIRADHVRDGLRDSGIDATPLDRSDFFRHLDHCVASGALPQPAVEPSRASAPKSRQDTNKPETAGNQPDTASDYCDRT